MAWLPEWHKNASCQKQGNLDVAQRNRGSPEPLSPTRNSQGGFAERQSAIISELAVCSATAPCVALPLSIDHPLVVASMQSLRETPYSSISACTSSPSSSIPCRRGEPHTYQTSGYYYPQSSRWRDASYSHRPARHAGPSM
jgi:hypothetical protein